MREHLDHDGVDDFVTRITRPLREPERLDADFEARVMSAVRGDAERERGRERRPEPRVVRRAGWWRRPRTIRVTPLAALAAAAGLIGVAALGAFGGARLGRGIDPRSIGATAAAAAETVHVVRFVLVDPSARGVSVVGDFNDWTKDAAPLREQRDGVWTVSVPVPAGRHEYAFIVHREHGDEWVADPFAATAHDEFGTETSIVTVGGPKSASGSSGAS
jgi:hypothetical protein